MGFKKSTKPYPEMNVVLQISCTETDMPTTCASGEVRDTSPNKMFTATDLYKPIYDKLKLQNSIFHLRGLLSFFYQRGACSEQTVDRQRPAKDYSFQIHSIEGNNPNIYSRVVSYYNMLSCVSGRRTLNGEGLGKNVNVCPHFSSG